MTLTFPTIAQQVLSEFTSSPKTISLATLARRRTATITHTSDWPPATVYTFDDDTSLTVTGRGRAHHITVNLP